jgi:hypothetical protein
VARGNDSGAGGGGRGGSAAEARGPHLPRRCSPRRDLCMATAFKRHALVDGAVPNGSGAHFLVPKHAEQRTRWHCWTASGDAHCGV